VHLLFLLYDEIFIIIWSNKGKKYYYSFSFVFVPSITSRYKKNRTIILYLI